MLVIPGILPFTLRVRVATLLASRLFLTIWSTTRTPLQKQAGKVTLVTCFCKHYGALLQFTD